MPPLCLFLRVLPAGALAAVVLLACSADEAAQTPSETAARPTATVTPAPADLRLGWEHERNGRYEEALAVYASVIDHGRESDRQEARLAATRVLLWEGRYEEAREQAAAYLEGAEDEPSRRAGLFLMARALSGLGRSEEALTMFSRYVEEGGLAAPYARVEMARLLASVGRSEEAALRAEEALSELPEQRRPAVLLMMAQALEGSDAAASARWYERLLSESESPADRALALWRLSALKRAAGDPTWVDVALQVVAGYPSTSAATEALDFLLDAGIEVDPLHEGLVRYRHYQNDEALAALRRCLEEGATGADAAAAHYYIGAIEERLGDDDAAIEEYGAAYRLAPDGQHAADALWWRGRLLEKQGRLEEALELYTLIVSAYPQAELATDAAFRMGLVMYRQGHFARAVSVWDSAAATAEGEDDRARARLWAAKGELAAGNARSAVGRLESLRRDYPLGYYGLRAEVLLREAGGPAGVTPGASPTPRAQVGAGGQASTGGSGAWSLWLDRRWLRGLQLVALGMPREAGYELRSLMYGSTSVSRLWALSRAARAFGLTEISARSAQLIVERLPYGVGLPRRELLRLAYPFGYAELMAKAEREEGVSPLVMLALIRQESFFDPLAGSVAGASGLTQVIPPTGEEIAGELGREFDPEALLRPETSVLFGAHYLAEQLSAFDGNLYHALAAYNAGPGAAARWQSAAPHDIDLFLEEIDSQQARLYVQLVMENLAVYRYLYGGEEYPRLPY